MFRVLTNHNRVFGHYAMLCATLIVAFVLRQPGEVTLMGLLFLVLAAISWTGGANKDRELASRWSAVRLESLAIHDQRCCWLIANAVTAEHRAAWEMTWLGRPRFR